MDLPLPEKALKFAAAELLSAAVVDSAAALSYADDLLPIKLGKMLPPHPSPAVMKYGRSLNALNGHLFSSSVALLAPISTLAKKP